MRIFTALILIMIVFFGGIMYGSYEKGQYANDFPIIQKQAEENDIMQMEPYHSENLHQEEVEVQETISMGEDVPLVHRMAQFFETLFVSVYDISLRMMYMIAELFY